MQPTRVGWRETLKHTDRLPSTWNCPSWQTCQLTAHSSTFNTTDPLARSLALLELQSKKMNGDRPIKHQIAELRALKSNLLNSGRNLSSTEWHNTIIQSLTGTWSQFAALGNSITNPEKFLNTPTIRRMMQDSNVEMRAGHEHRCLSL